ncbi:hypothetical protein JCM3766R1_000554 [Sporobolomyces carnicolor]
MLSPNSRARESGAATSSPRFDPSNSSDRSLTGTHANASNNKRLSRITPSEFDSLLSSSSTKHTTLLDEATLGSTSLDLSPQSSPERERERERDPITPSRESAMGGTDEDSFKRRSMFRSVGNASSPDLASLIRKAREQRQLEQQEAQQGRDGLDLASQSYDVESPTKPRAAVSRAQSPSQAGPSSPRPTPTRSRSTTSPEISLSEFAAQHSSAPPPRIFTSPSHSASSSSRVRESTTLSTDSATSSSNASSGFVLVPPPPPARSPTPPRTLTSTVQALKTQRQNQQELQMLEQLQSETRAQSALPRPTNHSTTSLISSFGFDLGGTSGPGPSTGSPRRRRGTTSDSSALGGFAGEDHAEGTGGTKLSLGNTMKKTSRFFRKFGGGGNAAAPSASGSLPPKSAINSSSQLPPKVPLPPPVPPIPSTYVSPARSRFALAGDGGTPTRPATTASATGLSPSKEMVRNPSNQSVASSNGSSYTAASSSSQSRVRRRRSSSVPQRLSQSDLGGEARAGGGGAGTSPTGGEGDRLRNELRLWRLGVDGVLGGFDSYSVPSEGDSRTRPAAGERRPSLPEGKVATTEFEGIKMGRNGSLPTYPESTLSGRGASEMPSIKLSSPKRTPSSTVTSSPNKRQTLILSPHEYADGLGSIPETSHSRENSNATIVSSANQNSPRLFNQHSPTFSPPLPPIPSMLPTSPPMVPTPSTKSNRSDKNAKSRISIVGYPVSSSSSISPTPTLSRHLASPTPSSATASSSKNGSTTSLPLTATGASSPGQASSQYSATSTLRRQDQGTEEPFDALEDKAKELARKCWDEDEGFLERKKIAEWLGSSHELNRKSLSFYVDRFDFGGLRLDLAFRRLCAKLYLKAETQQVDRILEQFSRKYHQDNTKSPYASADVVHAVSYSMLLLNTDLHVVDTTTRMTRQQFVRNTLNAIQAQTGLAAELADGDANGLFSPTISEIDGPIGDGEASSGLGMQMAAEGNVSRKSLDRPRTAGDGAGKRPSTSGGRAVGSDSPDGGSPNQSRVSLAGGAGAGTESPSRMTGLGLSQRSESVRTVGSVGSSKSLEANLQLVLKDLYNAIRSQPIYQSSSSSTLNLPSSSNESSRPSLSLSPTSSPYSTWSTGINRTASRRSGTSSAASSQIYGAASSSKRNSVRGFGALLGATGMGNSSLDLVRSSSPTPSTSTSLSDEHWSTAFGAATLHNVPTIGFANSLSHTIIREQQEEDTRSIASSSISVTDEELALLGAPWAKEGMLQRKHYWEVQGKRSKEKNWLKAFVVISQGELRMFRFDGGGGSSAKRGTGMGGGDWTSNASNVGAISLIHALCSAMPPPGYSRERPHCFVLTLPSGGTYFFQAGTPDLVSEWVQTCNYWSARLSREPLSGGVSNVEYGWNKVEARFDLGESEGREDVASVKSGKSGHSRMSYAASTFNTHAPGGGSANDRMRIEDWKPPNVPLSLSHLAEEAQLEHLKKHVKIVQSELEHHNELRAPMVKLYSSRSANHAKALANWERKSQHLLSEIVKWSTYIEALTSAVRLRSIQRGKKEVEAMLKSADLNDDDDDDDDELAARLSPFDDMPSRNAPSALSPFRSQDSVPSESVRRLQLDDKPKSARSSTEQHDERRSVYPSGSRTSVTTTSTRGGFDEFFDS